MGWFSDIFRGGKKKPETDWNAKSDDWYSRHSDQNEFGFTSRLPPEWAAADAQFKAERKAFERNKMLEGQALATQKEGLGNLQTYRPGGASSLLSPYYSNMSNVILGMRRDAPDLMFRYREHQATKARKAAERGAMLSSFVPIGQAGSNLAGQYQGAGAPPAGPGKGPEAAGASSGGEGAQGLATSAAQTGAKDAASQLASTQTAQQAGQQGPAGGTQIDPETGQRLGGGGGGGSQAATGGGGGGGAAGTQVAGASGAGGQVAGGAGIGGGIAGALLGEALGGGGGGTTGYAPPGDQGAIAYTPEGQADTFGTDFGMSSPDAAGMVAHMEDVAGYEFLDYQEEQMDGQMVALHAMMVEDRDVVYS